VAEPAAVYQYTRKEYGSGHVLCGCSMTSSGAVADVESFRVNVCGLADPFLRNGALRHVGSEAVKCSSLWSMSLFAGLVGSFKVCVIVVVVAYYQCVWKSIERDHPTIWTTICAQRGHMIQRYAFVNVARIIAVTKPLKSVVG
jgi:hypothetical protein